MTPETLAFQPYFTKLFWARESTVYRVPRPHRDTSATKGGGPGQAVPGIQAGVTLAYAAKTWQVKDLGAYNLAVLEPFQLGYKLG